MVMARWLKLETEKIWVSSSKGEALDEDAWVMAALSHWEATEAVEDQGEDDAGEVDRCWQLNIISMKIELNPYV